MRILSVNVGTPREVEWEGRRIETAIFKAPVAGRVRVLAENLEGDRQADLRVHGGPAKSVYAYPHEHYAWWAPQFPSQPMTPGTFGENLTLEGWLEDAVHAGDLFRAGSAEFRVVQPRMPCMKLAMRMGDPGMIARFLASGRSGFYLAVAREGEIGAGDAFERVAEDPRRVSVRDMWRLHFEGTEAGRAAGAPAAPGAADRELLERALAHEALPGFWRKSFTRRLEGPR